MDMHACDGVLHHGMQGTGKCTNEGDHERGTSSVPHRLLTTGYRRLPTDPYLCGNAAPMNILMVCLGNICRSPLAEGILQDRAWKAGLGWSVESAGTNGYHTGEPPHRLSQKVALQNGIDIRDQRSRTFVREDFRRFDRIFAMAPDVVEEMKQIAGKDYDPSKVDLLLDIVAPGRNLAVPDPWAGPERGFHEAYRIIDEACTALVGRYVNP